MTPEISRKLNVVRQQRNQEVQAEKVVSNFEHLYEQAQREADAYFAIILECVTCEIEDLLEDALREWTKWDQLARGFLRTLEVIYYS